MRKLTSVLHDVSVPLQDSPHLSLEVLVARVQQRSSGEEVVWVEEVVKPVVAVRGAPDARGHLGNTDALLHATVVGAELAHRAAVDAREEGLEVGRRDVAPRRQVALGPLRREVVVVGRQVEHDLPLAALGDGDRGGAIPALGPGVHGAQLGRRDRDVLEPRARSLPAGDQRDVARGLSAHGDGQVARLLRIRAQGVQARQAVLAEVVVLAVVLVFHLHHAPVEERVDGAGQEAEAVPHRPDLACASGAAADLQHHGPRARRERHRPHLLHHRGLGPVAQAADLHGDLLPRGAEHGGRGRTRVGRCEDLARRVLELQLPLGERAGAVAPGAREVAAEGGQPRLGKLEDRAGVAVAHRNALTVDPDLCTRARQGRASVVLGCASAADDAGSQDHRMPGPALKRRRAPLQHRVRAR
mmetsp:Transcript_9666/g.28528  ORF Transcript_9666/g.28528 Transcript_9666/m.28528 type:complete len:414 (+) Transcript_9666:1269-2510(+)